MLGDCLLHLTHHEMSNECYFIAMQFLTRTQQEFPYTLETEYLVQTYKAHYEREILNAFIRQHRLEDEDNSEIVGARIHNSVPVHRSE
jgi:hypothetical protein